MSELLDEISALQSIYEESILVDNSDNNGSMSITYKTEFCKVSFAIPKGYPATERPTVALSFQSKCNADRKRFIGEQLETTIAESGDEVALFAAIERFRELIACDEINATDKGQDEEADFVDAGDMEPVGPPIIINSSLKVIHGPVTVEQKSSFQSHIAEVHSMEDVHIFRQIVLSDKRIARATHNIFAYRFTCTKGTGVVYHDCDDDGETAAAGRVAEMMRLMGVDGVAVIVSRWFGGILLGPDRFKFICNSARNLLEENGYGKTAGSSSGQSKR